MTVPTREFSSKTLPTGTPADYMHFKLDGELPAKRIVGLLACQCDPLLRSLTSRVIAVRPVAAAPSAQKGRQKKAKGSAPASGASTPAAVPEGTLWDVELEDTVIFPEGGGQPWDTGRMILPDQTSLVIEGCVRRSLDAVHHVRVPPSTSFDPEALVGQDVTVTVDWARRTDHMVTHTGQHLLSAVLEKRGLPTLSWAMDAYPTFDPPYVELPRGLTWAEVQEVEAECNEIIAENRRIWIDVAPQVADAPAGKEESEFQREQRAIPKDYTGGVVRHCNIHGIDRNACCGTQCPSLSHVGFIHVIPPPTPWDAETPSSTAATRLYFVAGPRAVAHLAAASRTLSKTGQALGVPRDMIPERTVSLVATRAEYAEREKGIRAELSKTLGAALAVSAPVSAPAAARAQLLVRNSAATHDFEFMNAIATTYFAAVADAAAERATGEDASAALVAVSAPPGVNPALLLVQDTDHARGKTLYDEIKAAITPASRIKGGGARGRFMAKVEGWTEADTVALKKVLAA